MKNLVFLLLLLPGIIYGKDLFLGAIPVQYVSPDQELIIDTHRFFQPANNEKLEFSPTDDVDLSIDAAAFKLRAKANRVGLFDVVLLVHSNNGSLATVLTIACSGGTPSHHFVFKSESVAAGVPPANTDSAQPTRLPPQKQVFIAGSFNGWITNKNPLMGPNQNGEYVVDLPLAPGRYSYKFVVDGKWMLDPSNSETEDNGLGDKNSVVTVSAGKQSSAPTIFVDRSTREKILVRAVTNDIKLKGVSAIFESAVGSISIPAKIDNDQIDIAIPKESGFVRVVAADENGASNAIRCGVGWSMLFHWQDAIMYYALTDRFADGDKSNDHPVDDSRVLPPANFHGGDLRGVRDKIDNGYFESLGINTVWVAPLNKNPAVAYQESPEPHRWYTGYHGYWIRTSELRGI